MSNDEKKFYELSEKEQQDKLNSFKRKSKVVIKKILLGAFCITVILLMVFALLANAFRKDDLDSSSANTQAIVEIL